MQSEFIRLSEALQILGLKRSYFYKVIKMYPIETYRIGKSRLVWYKRSDIEAFFNDRLKSDV